MGKLPGAWATTAVDIKTNFGNYQGFMHDYSSYGWRSCSRQRMSDSPEGVCNVVGTYRIPKLRSKRAAVGTRPKFGDLIDDGCSPLCPWTSPLAVVVAHSLVVVSHCPSSPLPLALVAEGMYLLLACIDDIGARRGWSNKRRGVWETRGYIEHPMHPSPSLDGGGDEDRKHPTSVVNSTDVSCDCVACPWAPLTVKEHVSN